MIRIPSGDELGGPNLKVVGIPSTRYQLLPSGNLGSSSRILHITPTDAKPLASHGETLDDQQRFVDNPPPHDTASNFPPQMDPAYIEHLNEGFIPVKSPHVHRTHHNPSKRWLPERDTFLGEFLRGEGRGDHMPNGCHQCGSTLNGTYRCVDCAGAELMCCSCMVLVHQSNPLHRIEHWSNDSYFEKTTLKKLGLRIQLGHKARERCRNKAQAPGDDFVVLDVNGIHEVGLDFCDCETSKLEFIQLLRPQELPDAQF